MRRHLILLISILLLAACNPAGQGTATTPATGLSPENPTPSSTSESSPLAILVIPSSVSQEVSELYQTTVYDLTQDSGYRFQTRSFLTIEDLQSEPGLEVVVMFAPDPGLAALASAAPDVQFLGVDIPGLVAAGNISTIGGAGDTDTQRAFMAGYMAAVLSPDYRVGLITQDTTEAQAAIQAFANGRQYYCGLCRPSFPPWDYEYPVHPQIPAVVPAAQYAAYSDYLFDRLVDVTYVDPSVATAELLDYMARRGMNIIGERMLFEDLSTNWIASIQPDVIPAIQALWPGLVAGEGARSMGVPLRLVDVNPDLLSQGRQNLVEEVLEDLQQGLISTGVNP